MNIVQAMQDSQLFKPWFRNPETWAAWTVFLQALFALPMNAEEQRIYRELTGRTTPPTTPAREAWLVVGRRGGKSFIVSLIAVFLACFRNYEQCLAPGERGHVMVLACDRKQSRVIMRYVTSLLENIPMLAKLVQRTSAESIELTNRITLEIQTASMRSVRGYTVVAALCDEIAFWRSSDDAANPDSEILTALRPAMATVPNSLLIGLSSPYAKRGVLYQAHKSNYGRDGSPILIWQAPTEVMNPSVPQEIIAEAYDADPISAAAEYGAQFRSDLEAFVTREAVEACTPPGVHSRPYEERYQYRCFVDPSGGSFDSYTLAIGHKEGDRAILDLLLERKAPLSPEAVTNDFALLCKSYHVSDVTGDRYAGEWPREQFRKRGVNYHVADQNRSELYLELLPAIHSQQVALLDDPVLVNQLTQLERRTARSGKDSVDHPPGGHDDVANAAAGCVVLLTKKPAELFEYDLLEGCVINEAEGEWRYLTMF